MTTAYSVLSDPQERKWYDDHRESILRSGGDGTARQSGDDGEDVDLWKYFNPSCYKGPEDGKTGFYTVYNDVFQEIYESERQAGFDGRWVSVVM